MGDLLDALSKRIAPIKDPLRILTIDIERLPGLARAWHPKTRYIHPRDFKEWPRMVCFAARWYGRKQPIFKAEWIDRPAMLTAAWELYDQAEIVVTFNGQSFDNRHLKDEWLMGGFDPPRPWKDVDLYRMIRREFGFESKSLDTVTRRLGRPGKESHYSADVAEAAVAGDKGAQRQLRRYNIGDVELTEWLYDRLRGWNATHPHVGQGGGAQRCNQCGSDDLVEQRTKYRAVVLDYRLFRCANCGGLVRAGWHSTRIATTRGVR